VKILVLLADGFEDVEALSVIDILKRAKLEVDLVSIKNHEVVSSSQVKYLFDSLISEVDENEYDLLFLPGGRGVKLLDESVEVKQLIEAFYKKEKWIAAICAAPSILGKMGYLDHRNFTCFPSFEQYAENGIYHEVDVIQDGFIITGRGVAYAMEFALYLVKLLTDEKVYNEVCYRTLMKEKREN